MKLTFEYIKDHGLLLYEFIRGSKAHGCDTETSDTDYGGVYICPTNDILGLGFNYEEQVSNETNDIAFYEVGKFLRLLCNSNPTMLEMLFIDDKFVIYEHPIMTELKKHRDMFITKKCFKSCFSYAHSQISKCQGLNKLFTNPTTELKSPLDFCYTFYNQGSTKFINWLINHGLNQKYCGLIRIPNMHNVYGVYYDWKAHIEDNNISVDDMYNRVHLNGRLRGSDDDVTRFTQTIMWYYGCNTAPNPFIDLQYYLSNLTKRLGYSGIVAEDGSSKTIRYIQEDCTEKHGVMVNSVEKGAKPLCYVSFNAEGYAKHARDYTRYQKWLKERNPSRYENNKGHNYDAKNVSEAFRLMNMAIEIAKGEGVKVNRKNIDRDFLLDVKKHTYSYEELMTMLSEKEQIMHDVAETSQLPDDVDINKVNEILIDIRKKFYKKEPQEIYLNYNN